MEVSYRQLRLHYNDTFPQHKFSHTVPLSIEQLNDPIVVGSSHGLFCFYGYSSGMNMAVVWNPSIRKSVNVVVPNVFHGQYENVLGFGVCGNRYDVKILLRVTNMDDDGFQSYNLIMSFDMKSEEFEEIYLPERLALNGDIDYPISKLRESLVVLEYNIDAENPVYSVWMMEDDVSKSFTKLFTINTPSVSIKTISGFGRMGYELMQVTDMESNYNTVAERVVVGNGL
ncbi:putative F-box domain-containing protein [Tanacetum coccineum]